MWDGKSCTLLIMGKHLYEEVGQKNNWKIKKLNGTANAKLL